MINLKNCRVIIREQKKNSVLADTVILGHNLLTNTVSYTHLTLPTTSRV